MFKSLFSVCTWGFLSAVAIMLACVFLYCLFLAAGLWVALGIVLFIVFVCRSEEKKLKVRAAHNAEYGAEPSQRESKGINTADFALGWIFSRLFK
jgi:hypothetical protein